MIQATRELPTEAELREQFAEFEYETWRHWPIHWSGVWVGALAAFAAALIIGLVAVAIGAHLLQPEHRVVDLRKISLTTAAFGIFGSFLSMVIGAWVAGRIAGILRAEPAMLHGAVVWLVSLPLFVLAAALGAGSYLGVWHSGLKPATDSAAPFERPAQLAANAAPDVQAENRAAWSEYRQNVARWKEETPRATRNAALCAVTSLLLGLIGSVVGGWMASGEPMTFSYYRKRPTVAARN